MILLISEQYLKDNDVIFENVDVKMITPAIIEAQDIDIQRLTGSTLMNRIFDEIESGTISGIYKKLLDDYIQPALQRYAKSRVLMIVSNQITNKNVAQKDGGASDEQVANLTMHYKSSADWYGQRLVSFLCENSSKFPEYENPGSGQDVIKPLKTAFRNPFMK